MEPKKDAAMEFKNGSMAQSTKAIGSKTKQKAKVPSGMLKETYTLVISRLIKHVDLESTLMSMVVAMKENGLMMCSRAREKKPGSTEQNM